MLFNVSPPESQLTIYPLGSILDEINLDSSFKTSSFDLFGCCCPFISMNFKEVFLGNCFWSKDLYKLDLDIDACFLLYLPGTHLYLLESYYSLFEF